VGVLDGRLFYKIFELAIDVESPTMSITKGANSALVLV